MDGAITVGIYAFNMSLVWLIDAYSGGIHAYSRGVAQPNREDFILLTELLEAGKVVPVIDKRYPLSEIVDALRYLEEGHAQGKVVITMDHDNT